MGLGTVVEVEQRTVTLRFPATDECRIYARQGSPLTRVRIPVGEDISDQSGNRFSVLSLLEDGGLIRYRVMDDDGNESMLDETELDHLIQLNRPTDRLFSGQIDTDKQFSLRYQTLRYSNRRLHSPVYGLCGGRTSLLPHQLYIAHEVSHRYAPRVLLADEVGLGKTIEAGLIIHQQLLTERARRVLIVVPETLVHQWLVEMLRRFNLHFSIFDEERYASVQQEDPQHNPFQSEQLVLCSLEFLLASSDRYNDVVSAGWDMLVVDEAHHLEWSPEEVSLEYDLVEALARATRGVLLLTATPEQLGKASHFARLRLLDPDRFNDLGRFLQEENEYAPIAAAVEKLLSDQKLDTATYRLLVDTVNEGDNQSLLEQLESNDIRKRKRAEQKLVEHLLDRHGTGRVLFRNTRATVKGFPLREVHPYPLDWPEDYAEAMESLEGSETLEAELLLYPELVYEVTKQEGQPEWWQTDTRIPWLAQQLKQLRPKKILVITASADTALDLARTLKVEQGVHAAVFHEGMSIVERDRAAAFFADPDGTQILICSEIGSEGRNFQFAHHMILFDLPLNPDLLEQRIGRLDRIGQNETIHIHVPYFEHSSQSVMFHWYHQGLHAFEHTCPAGHNVFVEVETELVHALRQVETDDQAIHALVRRSHNIYQKMVEALHKGRDRLLEYNSCRPVQAQALQKTAASTDNDPALLEYLENIFDCYGVDSDFHSEHCLVIRPTDHIQASIPGLTEDGMTITFDRNIALTNEDMQFMTWEHPLVSWSIDAVLSSELGNSALTVVKDDRYKPGTLLLECLYVLESASSDSIQTLRYLPPTTIRVVADQRGRDHARLLPHDLINKDLGAVPVETAAQIVRNEETAIKELMAAADQLAASKANEILEDAHTQTRDTLSTEINRLKALRQVNPTIRDEEIEYFESQWIALNNVLDSAKPRLDAVRVVVTT